MKKQEVVKSKQDFEKIIKSGKKISNKYFSIFYKETNLDFAKFGITISKKSGNAVYRNKNKRQLRMIITNNKQLFNNNYNYIIIINKEGSFLSYHLKEKHLLSMLEEIYE